MSGAWTRRITAAKTAQHFAMMPGLGDKSSLLSSLFWSGGKLVDYTLATLGLYSFFGTGGSGSLALAASISCGTNGKGGAE